MASTDLFIGGMLGEYRIERVLGQSQLGAAYLAQQPAQGSSVMVTTFNLPEGMSVQAREQFTAMHRMHIPRPTSPAETAPSWDTPRIFPRNVCWACPMALALTSTRWE